MKNLIVLLCLLIGGSTFAQDFQGKAIYKTHRKMNMSFGGESGMSDAMKERMSAQMKKQFQKTFTLDFTKNESIYKEDKKLSAPSARSVQGNMVMVIGGGGGSDVYYKNIKDKKFVNKTEIMGKRFLIKDKLPTYDWKLTGETKNIGVYTCYKATYTRQEERSNMTVNDGEVTESKKMVDVVTTAWYTPKIAVSNGPGSYNGLPGLILEIKEGSQTIVCSEIIMNPKEKVTIVVPKKGKVVSQAKYEEIMSKKMKEQMEKFKNSRGHKGNVEFRIGG